MPFSKRTQQRRDKERREEDHKRRQLSLTPLLLRLPVLRPSTGPDPIATGVASAPASDAAAAPAVDAAAVRAPRDRAAKAPARMQSAIAQKAAEQSRRGGKRAGAGRPPKHGACQRAARPLLPLTYGCRRKEGTRL